MTLSLQHRELKSPIHWRNRENAAKRMDCWGRPLVTNESLRSKFNSLPSLLDEGLANAESVANINTYLAGQKEKAA